ncbi:hypothetical protein [Cellvibrio sp. NN19]|uniref:hypothetical protein n=1 Tax=Cellvibrio chitinivorans TaxID=3102792 RepID=UPI002B411EC1|nr:hypothetical protein [Cellvibrio sp. NN19]
MDKENSVWITWEHQVRNISMANLLGCNYVELRSDKSRIVRYLKLAILTISILRSGNYKIIFFQNPSIVLGLVCALYKKLKPNCLVVGDFHNAALEPGRLRKFNRFICKSIDITLVSNTNLFGTVTEMGGRPFAFPDPIPASDASVIHDFKVKNYILFISSWADDEPINNVLNAFIATGLWRETYELHVTGRIKESKLEKPKESYETFGIKFLGYLSEEDYWRSLIESVINIDLTTRKDCLVCGAYESISVAVPVLLSNNAASVNYFGDYALFTDNSPEDIKAKLELAIEDIDKIREKAQSVKRKYIEGDALNKQKLSQLLNQ